MTELQSAVEYLSHCTDLKIISGYPTGGWGFTIEADGERFDGSNYIPEESIILAVQYFRARRMAKEMIKNAKITV